VTHVSQGCSKATRSSTLARLVVFEPQAILPPHPQATETPDVSSVPGQ